MLRFICFPSILGILKSNPITVAKSLAFEKIALNSETQFLRFSSKIYFIPSIDEEAFAKSNDVDCKNRDIGIVSLSTSTIANIHINKLTIVYG